MRVVSGEVFDVAVDLRPGSETYGKWFGVVLSAENKKQFFIPKNLQHDLSYCPSPQNLHTNVRISIIQTMKAD